MEKVERIKELVQKLNIYSYEYYTLGKPSISDETYDLLYDELVGLEHDTGLRLSQSPTRKVGNVTLSKLQKSTHKYPMLSLDKIKYKDLETLFKWINHKDVVCMPKFDGLTVDLTYINGELVKGETRGDGVQGETISHNVKTFVNIPLSIPYEDTEVHIIGEAIIDYETFNTINSKLPKEEQYKTPRNLVSGSVRQLNSEICKSRGVKFYGYITEGIDFETKINQLNFIKEQGFDEIHDVITMYDSFDDLENTTIPYMKEMAKRNNLPIDGLVFMYNDIQYGKSLGSTSKFPLHSKALKFADDMEITKLIKVEWQVGRTSQITPVAYFDPVILDGTEVNKASLHNVSILKELNLHVGDSVSTYKANMIIPQIKDNLGGGIESIKIPSVCPCCGYPTEIRCDNESEVLYCTFDNCKAKLIQRLTHYCSRDAMNIEGLSEKTLEKFIELGFIKDILDIYSLSQYKDKIINLDGFGKKSYDNLISAIEKSKTCKLEQFIFALGIPNVGKSTAKDICNYFSSNFSPFDSIFNYSENELLNIELLNVKDIGETTANSFIKFVDDSNNINTITKLKGILNFEMYEPKQEISNTDNPLNGLHVYPTGKFTLKKDEVKVELEKIGAIVENGYKKSLDYLICGNDMSKSSKGDKAIKDGVKIMTEDNFMDIVNSNHN